MKWKGDYDVRGFMASRNFFGYLKFATELRSSDAPRARSRFSASRFIAQFDVFQRPGISSDLVCCSKTRNPRPGISRLQWTEAPASHQRYGWDARRTVWLAWISSSGTTRMLALAGIRPGDRLDIACARVYVSARWRIYGRAGLIFPAKWLRAPDSEPLNSVSQNIH
jgi:hypothetical protein